MFISFRVISLTMILQGSEVIQTVLGLVVQFQLRRRFTLQEGERGGEGVWAPNFHHRLTPLPGKVPAIHTHSHSFVFSCQNATKQ